jgi:secondary thiamine-phosphate synthase enzyme
MIQHHLTIHTTGRGMINITDQINNLVKADLKIGLCNIFLHHTSASLTLCENADPQVQHDAEAFMQRLSPDGDKLFKHTAEGADDMPAHIRTMLTQNSITIPITDGKLSLGTWQGLYLWEHRLNAFKRTIIVTIMD